MLNLKKVMSFLFIVFLPIFFLFFSCKNGVLPGNPEEDYLFESETELKTINIGVLRGPTAIGMLKLLDEKYTPINSVNIVFEIVPNPEIMVSKLISGEIDIAALPTNTAVNLYNKDIDYKIAAIIGYGVLYMLTQDLNISSWTSLKDNVVHIPSRGTTPDIITRYLLYNNGVDPENDIDFVFSYDQVELSQLMINGDIKISVLPEPFVTKVLKNNSDIKIAFNLEEEWGKINRNSDLPMSCLLIKSSLIEESVDIVRIFLEHYKDSINWANNNPDEVASLAKKYDIGIESSIIIESIPRCNIRFTYAYEAKEEVDRYIGLLYNFSPECIGGRLPDENIYYLEKF